MLNVRVTSRLGRLRVGYGVGGASWVGALDRVRQPFNTNSLAQAAALESLRHPEELDRRVRSVISERSRMERELSATSWPFTPSQGNFILVRPDIDPAAGSTGIHERLLRLGVIVRDGAALGCSGCLRVSIGTPDENAVFLSARAEIARPAPRETQPGRTPQ